MISILCPTRGRPTQFQQMCQSMYETALAYDDVMMAAGFEVVAYLDGDDVTRDGYYDTPFWFVRFVEGARICLSDMWNRCAEAAHGDILMQCGDDIRFRTKGWNQLVEDVFANYTDGIAFVHGRDLSPNDGVHGTHGFVTRRWYETVGYMVPDGFVSDYSDTWMNDLANRVGRRVYVEELVTEHLHFTLGKADIDQTTQDRIARHNVERPDLRYRETEPQRAADADKLRSVLEAAA